MRTKMKAYKVRRDEKCDGILLIHFTICSVFPDLFIFSRKSVEVGVNRRGFEQICSYVLFSLCVWTV